MTGKVVVHVLCHWTPDSPAACATSACRNPSARTLFCAYNAFLLAAGGLLSSEPIREHRHIVTVPSRRIP